MSNADKAMGIALGSVGIAALIFVGAICVPVIIKDKNQTKDSLETQKLKKIWMLTLSAHKISFLTKQMKTIL